MNPDQSQVSAILDPGNQPQDSGTGQQSQIDAILGRSDTLTHQDASKGLAFSNRILQNLIHNPVSQAGVGFAKSGIWTGMEMGKLASEAGSKLPGEAGQFFQQRLQAGEQEMQNPAFQAQNTSQEVGKGVGDVAQFFVPGGAEKSLFEKGAMYIDKLPGIIGATGKAGRILSGTLKTALKSAITGGSFGAVQTAQTGDVSQGEGAVQLGAMTGGLGEALKTISPELLNALNKADFRLPPAVEAKTTKIATAAANFITNNKIEGTVATKFNKLSGLTFQFENLFKKSLPTNIIIPKEIIADDMRTALEQLRNTDEALYGKARPKVDEAMSRLQENPSDSLSTKQILSNKRSWASDAFKTSKKSKKDPEVSAIGSYIAQEAYQKALYTSYEIAGEEVPIPQGLRSFFGNQESVSPQEFMQVYSDAINAKNLTYAAQFRNDIGLVGRIFGLYGGETVGSALGASGVGKLPYAAAGEMLTQKGPGAVRNILERGLNRPTLPESGARIFEGATNALGSQDQNQDSQNFPDALSSNSQ